MAASRVLVLCRASAFLPSVRSFVSRPATTGFNRKANFRFLSDGPSSSSNRLSDRPTTAYDKWILGLYKKYPKGKVPDFVPSAVIEKTRNKARIHLNLILSALTLISAYLAASYGRRRHERGDSWAKMNQEWHESQKRS